MINIVGVRGKIVKEKTILRHQPAHVDIVLAGPEWLNSSVGHSSARDEEGNEMSCFMLCHFIPKKTRGHYPKTTEMVYGKGFEVEERGTNRKKPMRLIIATSWSEPTERGCVVSVGPIVSLFVSCCEDGDRERREGWRQKPKKA